jgi:hypothetical protein
MKTMKMAGIGGLAAVAAGLASAQQAFATSLSSAIFGGADFAPVLAALLALAYLSQGGRRRLRM